jgi:heme-degrading monooxygenase HmoA
MFVNVGRFHLRPMGEDEQQTMMQRMEQDMPPIARESPGFRGLYLARPSDDEVMTVWLWDSEGDWEAALAQVRTLAAGIRHP